jgi:hypothetical protein
LTGIRQAKWDRVTRTAHNQIDQFIAAGYEPKWAEITSQKTFAGSRCRQTPLFR